MQQDIGILQIKNSLREDMQAQINQYLQSGKKIHEVPGYSPKTKPAQKYTTDPLAIAMSRGSFHNKLERLLQITPMDIPAIAGLVGVPVEHLKELAARHRMGTQYLLEKIARAIVAARK